MNDGLNRDMLFDFTDESVVGAPDTHVARLPARLEKKEELLNALFKQLQLPGYFGFNWDALSDCLRDFHWLQTRTVVLVHVDLPLLLPEERRTYFEILADAVHDWQADPNHDFRVVFPNAAQAEITATLAP